MRTQTVRLAAGIMGGLLAAGADGAVVNLAESASGTGLLPVVALSQGSPNGIRDGGMFDWFNGASSPRNFSLTNLQPYMIWSALQDVRLVRAWGDVGNTYDRIRIDTLTGTDPTQEADWVNRYDSGTGLGQRFVDVDLGASYSTQGVRVRVDKAAVDVNVGEVDVFSALPVTGTLTANLVPATGATASSSEYGAPGDAIDGSWYGNRWMGASPAANPDPSYWLQASYDNADVSLISLTFCAQGNYSVVPRTYTLELEDGSGWHTIGTFNRPDDVRQHFYHDLGTSYFGVQNIRVSALEGADLDGFRLALQEIEAFDVIFIPEPATAAILALASLGLLARRRGV